MLGIVTLLLRNGDYLGMYVGYIRNISIYIHTIHLLSRTVPSSNGAILATFSVVSREGAWSNNHFMVHTSNIPYSVLEYRAKVEIELEQLTISIK